MVERRDFEARPYTPDEARVAKYIVETTDIGGGDDPIGFLMGSHALLAQANSQGITVRDLLEKDEHENPSP